MLTRASSTSTSTLYAPLGSLFQAQGGNCETTSYIHQHLQNSKNSGRFERQNSTSIAETSHEGKFFQRQKFVIKVLQCRSHRDRNGPLASFTAWRLPSKTVQDSETSADEKGARKKKKKSKYPRNILGGHCVCAPVVAKLKPS